MDFVVGHTKTRRQHDYVWIIVDVIIMSAHILAVKSTYRAEDYKVLYINEIVK